MWKKNQCKWLNIEQKHLRDTLILEIGKPHDKISWWKKIKLFFNNMGVYLFIVTKIKKITEIQLRS